MDLDVLVFSDSILKYLPTSVSSGSYNINSDLSFGEGQLQRPYGPGMCLPLSTTACLEIGPMLWSFTLKPIADYCQVSMMVMAIFIGPTFAVYQEMSWVMDMDHISYHPGYTADEFRFKYYIAQAGLFMNTDIFVAFNRYSTVEHMGTHVDAPYHVSKTGRFMDEVPLEDLIGPLVKIDIQEKAKSDSDALITVEDLEKWEQKNGRIPNGAFIIQSSGWDKFYGNQVKYVGTDVHDGDTHSPGFGKEASEWLLSKRNIKGIGVDTVSCDAGNSTFPAHRAVLPANKLCIENLRDVGKVPECGAKLSALPIMMKNGTGTQARVFAEWYQGVGYMTSCKGQLKEGFAEFMTAASSPQVVSLCVVLFSMFSFMFMI